MLPLDIACQSAHYSLLFIENFDFIKSRQTFYARKRIITIKNQNNAGILEIPGNSRGNSRDALFLGFPERESPAALGQVYM